MTDQTLLSYIPNYIAPGYDESRLIDKISPCVKAAEDFVNIYICPAEIYADSDELKLKIEPIVALKALSLAAPLLDVTMHPNGLAVVNTESVAPASAERSAQFRRALDRMLCLAIDDAVSSLETYPQWRESKPATDIWLATVFCGCQDIAEYVNIPLDCDLMIKAIRDIQAIESVIADQFISPELLKQLRTGDYDMEYGQAIHNFLKMLKHAIAKINVDKKYNRPELYWLVDYIRQNPKAFPQWFTSHQAKIFSPPVFRNKKASGGYFF